MTLEYEVHGKFLKTGVAYDNRFVSIVIIENRKIVRWRDDMDSLAACTARQVNNRSVEFARPPKSRSDPRPIALAAGLIRSSVDTRRHDVVSNEFTARGAMTSGR